MSTNVNNEDDLRPSQHLTSLSLLRCALVLVRCTIRVEGVSYYHTVMTIVHIFALAIFHKHKKK